MKGAVNLGTPREVLVSLCDVTTLHMAMALGPVTVLALVFFFIFYIYRYLHYYHRVFYVIKDALLIALDNLEGASYLGKFPIRRY